MKSNKILFYSDQSAINTLLCHALSLPFLKSKNLEIGISGGKLPVSVFQSIQKTLESKTLEILNVDPIPLSKIKDYYFDLVVVVTSKDTNRKLHFNGVPTCVYWNLDEPDYKDIDFFQKNYSILKSLVYNFFEKGYYDGFIMQQNNMHRVLNSVADGIIAHDLNRKIFFFSEKASRLTGIKAEDAIGRDCHHIFTEHLCGKNCSFCDVFLSNDFTPKNYHSNFFTISGEIKECKISVVPLKDENGNVQGIVASLHDLTKISQLEEILGRKHSFEGIIGSDNQMLQIFQQIKDVALYDYPVHIYGETGTGKELVARAIHSSSNRRNGPFVPINCGALPENLIESELFGHVKGSFTGAIKDKKGRFELANEGTLFLDEVAELPKHLQVKLLRVIQESVLEKVGDEKTISINVRIISATNLDIKSEVQNDQFREDLYYRLNVIPVALPPLRKRKIDIPHLAAHFLKENKTEHLPHPISLSSEAMALMMDYDWPGNVRELENVIRFAVVKSKQNQILPEDLPLEIYQPVNSITVKASKGPNKKLQLETVRLILKETDGNKAKTAKKLGVGRATLYRFLKDYPELA